MYDKKIYNNYKIRLYPSKIQEEMFRNHINCCRFVWNQFLDLENKNYEEGNKFIKRFGLIKKLPELKEKHQWLKEVSNISLQITCTDLSIAFDRFFRKISKYPKFKSKKKSKKSFPIRADRLYFKDTVCHIEKVGKVKYKTDLEIPKGNRLTCKFYDSRILYENGKWYLSVKTMEYIECESQTLDKPDKSLIGIDLSVKELAVIAHDNKQYIYHNINKSKKMRFLENKKNRISKSISRKYRTNGNYEKSNNIIREEKKLSKVYKKMTDIRNNYIHQVTNEIIKMKPDRVTMEKLNITGMMKNKYLSKSIQEQKFFMFIKTMKYKCEDNNIEFIQVPANYPSSKTCSSCGYIKKDLRLKDRVFICPECGLKIDRDYNAAINLMNYTK